MLSNKELSEVFESLAIPAYRKCIDDIRGKGLRDAFRICRNASVLSGVCWFMHENSIIVYGHPLIEKYHSIGGRWCKAPLHATSTAEIISLHERRIEIMQEIIDYVKNEILK